MFAFFRTAEVFAFADALASEYDRLRRSTVVRHDSAEKKEQKFDKLLQKVDGYCRENKLNFYKKSRMLYALKKGLQAKDVPPEDIDGFLEKVMMQGLARR